MKIRPAPLQRQFVIFLAVLFVCVFHGFGAVTRLSVSSNHRYLVDASGKPFFLVGDCPQNLPLKLSVSELNDYMIDCHNKGFNLLWICIDGQRGFNGKPGTPPPRDRANNLMMTNGWDISTLNEVYFGTIDAILDQAQQHDLYCLLTPLSECQWTQANINSNSADKWHTYGLYLGRRYQDQANLIWQFGNDTINEQAQHAIVKGIKDAGDTHLMTVNWRPGHQQLGSPWVRKHQHGENWIDLDAWYENAPVTKSGAACFWQKIEYERPDPMPSFLTEGPYQLPDPKGATDLHIRMLNFYVALGGGCGGHVYGAGWLADEWDYETYRNNGGRVQTLHFRNLFANRDWPTLVPDYSHTFVTAGYGTLSKDTLDYVGAAINGGTLGMAYCPKTTPISVDLSKFSGPAKAHWYDPTAGTFKNIDGSPFANSGARDFTPPGRNSTGDTDWVLVLESPPNTR